MIEDDSRHQIYLPWHFRDRLTPTRTYAGRVVYERPKHFFGLSDVDRVLKRINPPAQPSPDKFLTLLKAIWSLCAGTAIPFNFDFMAFSSVFDYLHWAIGNTMSVLTNPYGELKTRTIALILAFFDVFGITIYDVGAPRPPEE